MSYHYHHLNGYCGCYYVVSHSHHSTPYTPSIRWLPQVTLSAHTTILSTTSRTTLTQTFSNPSSKDAIPEAIYTFPLYDGVGVVGFNCRVGGRVIRGLVKEKAKAKAIYDEAVSRGETAGLLTQLPESSDVFTTKIGNIPAKGEVVVEITYFGELKHDAEADGIRFTIPTTIAPRYGDIPGGIAEPWSGSGSLQADAGGGIQITVDVSLPSKSNIRGIQSPSHPIAVTMGSTTVGSTGGEFEPNKGAATLSLGKAELEKDFVLLVLAPDIVKPQALLETHPTIPNQRALMVTLVPKFVLPPSKPEIVFIVDRSGSMASNIPTLISALKVFLKSLPVGVKFNICSFGSTYSMLWKRSRSYDQTTLKSAINHVEKFSANMGGTEMFKAVKAVVENRYKDMALEVMLLTDGEIWNQEELFSYLNKEVQDSEAPIRVFTLGIGNAVSHSLIEGIARAGNGFSQAVGLDEKLDGKVVRMLKGGLSPHVNDYSLEVKYENDGQDDDYEVIEKVSEGFRILNLRNPGPTPVGEETPQKKISLFSEDVDMDRETTPEADPDGTAEKYAHLPGVPPPKLLQSPNRIPPLFPFSRTVVYLLMSPQSCQRTPKSVVLKGTSSYGPLELEIPVQLLPDKAETIHQLAARKAIRELEEGRGWIFDARDEGGVPIKERFEGNWEDIVEREGVRLGIEFQVGGKWCSFVAVEANDMELAEKERKTTEATERRDSEKVLIADRREGGGFEILDSLGGAHTRTPQSPSLASSTISTGTFTDVSATSSYGAGGRARLYGGILTAGRASSPGAAPLGASGSLYSSSPLPPRAYPAPSAPVPQAGAALQAAVYRPCAPMPAPPPVKRGAVGQSLDPLPRRGGEKQRSATLGLFKVSRKSKKTHSSLHYEGDNDDAGADNSLSSSSPADPTELLHKLIDLQSFSGSWDLTDALCALLGITIDDAMVKVDTHLWTAWATTLAVVFCETRFQNDADVWDLVVDKAKGWLREEAGKGVAVEGLEGKAKEVLGSI
ncbi:hypothetical protein GP486_003447 [Trichoglossum hirsutum]|uniref:von Willebrand domain containing protein n=1 Tax=Trichoglossum hirsutum TaxID=265104 RepID=A0A9P8RQN0_9PEZI|nr:hypothetical protein GP486_003447 [Trichoglossum hirsutum]